jgi:hypothetical protein
MTYVTGNLLPLAYNYIILEEESVKMLEDFGWSGDEFLMGDCQDDWVMDLLDAGVESYEEERRIRGLLAGEDEVITEGELERDLADIVREHDEREDREFEPDEEEAYERYVDAQATRRSWNEPPEYR